MKIAYIDLNEDHYEDYSVNPNKYGGGRIFAAHAKSSLNDKDNLFMVYADPKAFESMVLSQERAFCKPLTAQNRADLRNGKHILTVIPEAAEYDLIVHHFTSYWINIEGLKCKQVVWSIGYSELVHENFPYVILYNDYQAPRIKNPNTKVLKAKIGVPVGKFEERIKQDYIFQCTRHTEAFGSKIVANFCLMHGIKGVFAGPIDQGYDLMSYIDGKTTQYLGVITEEEKIKWTKQARLYSFLHVWPTPMNLSALESLSYGTPIAATPVGFWRSLITPKNGFIVSNLDQLRDAYIGAAYLKQQDCYDTALQYSTEVMIKEFTDAFKIVLQ